MFEYPVTYLVLVLIALLIGGAWLLDRADQAARRDAAAQFPVAIGTAWDSARPGPAYGTRVDFGFSGQSRAIEVREYNGRQYVLTWSRDPGGPYVLRRIEGR